MNSRNVRQILKLTRSVAVLLLAVLVTPAIFTQAKAIDLNCDDSLVPAQENTPYAMRKDRCEGFYSVRKVADATLSLIGYVRGRLYYSLKDDELINVTVDPGVPADYDPILIRGQPYLLQTLYRMDSVLDRNGVLNWPVSEVLLPEKIKARHIGVYGTYVNQGDAAKDNYSVQVPLIIQSQGLGNKNDTRLRIYLRASQDVDELWNYWDCPGHEPYVEKTVKVHRSSKKITVFPPKQLSGKCFARFEARILKTDPGVDPKYVKLEIVIQLI